MLGESALAAADAADRREKPTGPLHDVPFTVEENNRLPRGADHPWSADLADRVPSVEAPVEAPVVERMKAEPLITPPHYRHLT
ncbi:MAG TPA: hypothetical protein VMT85_16515 [Thermoanaerobaculia bacterium]|nr:hypothetical protein [Thermoanaerobaculia bacterium]